jgi:hypothetical protein
MSATQQFKSKRPALSPMRQALADAIQKLKALEAQQASLDAAVSFNGKAVVRVRTAEDAVLAAEEARQQAIDNDADQHVGGPVPTMTPRHAREALLRAQDEVTDAKVSLERTEQHFLRTKQEVHYATMARDAAHEAVLLEQPGQVQRLVFEVERLQSELAAKGQLLEALAGQAGLFHKNYVFCAAVSNWYVPPVSWEIAWRPLPLVALYKDAVERLKRDATVVLPDVTQPTQDEHLVPPVEVEQVTAPKPQFAATLNPGFRPDRVPTPDPQPHQLRGNQQPNAVQTDGRFEAQRNPIRTGRIGSGLNQVTT